MLNNDSIEYVFIDKVITIMKDRNLSRADLARQLGVSSASISKLLTKPPNISINRMLKIAEVLECKLDISLTKKEELLSIEDVEAFIKASEAPFVPNERMVRAMKLYNETVRNEELIINEKL